MLNLFRDMADDYEDRKVDCWNNEDGSQMVSTVAVSDGREPFETAVQHPAYHEGKMVIVECYPTKEDAQAGHDKWLNLVLADKLPITLIDCGNAQISQLIGAVGGTMAFEKNTGIEKAEGPK